MELLKGTTLLGSSTDLLICREENSTSSGDVPDPTCDARTAEEIEEISQVRDYVTQVSMLAGLRGFSAVDPGIDPALGACGVGRTFIQIYSTLVS